jgi:hypothetical protein
MQWVTHIRICKKVLYELGVTPSSIEASKLREGVVEPDKWGDWPHHHGKSGDIERYIMSARRSFLQNDFSNAYYYLGFALHYIQDAYTSVKHYDSPNNQKWHQNYEQEIESERFVLDLEREIQYRFRNDYPEMKKYSDIARDLSRNVEGKNDTLRVATLVGRTPSLKLGKAIIDLNMALKASYVVSKSVLLSPKNCPELDATLSRILKEHERLLQNMELSFSSEIANLVRQRDALKGKIVHESGFVRKIKNWFYGVRVGLQNRRIDGKMREYNSQSHLHRVVGEYKHATNMTISPYEGWYNFQIPTINFGVVAKEVLTIAEVSAHLGFDTDTIRALLGKGGHPCLFVGNKELILRSELNEVLSRFTPNGIREYKSQN